MRGREGGIEGEKEELRERKSERESREREKGKRDEKEKDRRDITYILRSNT